jgi:type VI protein secretion system component VasK
LIGREVNPAIPGKRKGQGQIKAIIYSIALVVLALFTSAAFANEPILTSAEAKFDTTTNSKNRDTKLDVFVKNSDGNEVAKSEGNGGRWDRNSSHTVSLHFEGNPTKADVENGTVRLALHPNKNNKWAFNYKVTLKFSDGTIITKELKGCVLTQSDATRTDSLK